MPDDSPEITDRIRAEREKLTRLSVQLTGLEEEMRRIRQTIAELTDPGPPQRRSTGGEAANDGELK